MADKTTLNLEDRNVFETEATVEQVRTMFDGEGKLPDEVETTFDNAQGFVHSGEGPEAFVVVRIKK